VLGRAGNWGSSAGFFEGTRKGSETYLMLGVMSWVNRSERDAPNQDRVVWQCGGHCSSPSLLGL